MKTFMSKTDGEKYLNYLLVWKDAQNQKHVEAYHTRKAAENSDPFVSGYADVYTRKQFKDATK